MSRVTVSIFQVDRGFQEFDITPKDLDRLRSLRARGIEGRELIDSWLGDDWGVPPRIVTVTGEKPDGERVDIKIVYE